jgi:hypothetical protein
MKNLFSGNYLIDKCKGLVNKKSGHEQLKTNLILACLIYKYS